MSESLFFTATAEDFKKIPGSPVAYWVSEKIGQHFLTNKKIQDFCPGLFGMSTADQTIIMYWYEPNFRRILFNAHQSIYFNKKTPFAPYDKGGKSKKWYGNRNFIINWDNDGSLVRENKKAAVRNSQFFCKPHISWTLVTSGIFSCRKFEEGFLLDTASNAIYDTDKISPYIIMGILNSSYMKYISKVINPTLNFSCGVINKIPIPNNISELKKTIPNTESCLIVAKKDWDAYETSWDFQSLPLLRPEYRSHSLPVAYAGVRAAWQAMTEEMQRLEEENNRVFIEAYGLQDELTPDVPIKEITLTCNPFYRYGVDAEQADTATRTALEARLRADSVKELLSYAIGCMMGRYSLDAAGLVYAAAGNAGFDAGKYTTFPADEDGIVPLGDMPWFDDDAAHRFREFCLAVWGEESLEESLRFVAAQLDPKRGETPEATIRRWLSGKFFKDWHCKVYKNRPIYWLFSSGKYKAFECLVYLHRFNSNTLPRMRAAYVTPLQGKIAARLELLEREEAGAGSTSSRNALKKQRELLLKKQDELRHFDDLLRHYADQNIQLDLDDGVKVNYAKLADLLAESKTITGGKEE